MADEFMDNGIFLSKASKAREFAILETQRTLKAKSILTGRSLLNVSPYLNETLFEFTHWCWDKENKPRDERDHAMENLGRLLLEEPRWIAQDSGEFNVKELDYSAGVPLDLEEFSLD